jgi:hypothetical protein
MTATESPPGTTPHGTGRGRLARSRLALLDYFAHTPEKKASSEIGTGFHRTFKAWENFSPCSN